MKNKNAFLFLFDGFADWEPALALANLNAHSEYAVHTFSVNGLRVRSMAGIEVLPKMPLENVAVNEVDLLILPGGDPWEKGGNAEIIPLINQVINTPITIAAICGATLFLAENSWLDKRPHTSNGLEYLKRLAPHYQGAEFYRHAPCVTDDNLITANGAAMIDFAMAIFRKCEIADPHTLDKVADLYHSSGMNNRLS
ncbi:MAG TPA: type 1 glutamine amidotransferase family protein, partial [Puia sp.]|nr:type 1 glutamine amidotransferase family protein [Puia sp.]